MKYQKRSLVFSLCFAGVLLTGWNARAGKPGSTRVSHTAAQGTPIQLGSSGGWQNDLANGYCCGGTLGALVQDSGGEQYILSNFHVLAGDRVAGGNGYTADIGAAVIIHPGLIDVNCTSSRGVTVATLSAYANPVLGANVDAAIGKVVPGMVSSDILEIGTLSRDTAVAFVGQKVKKSGRTTGLTRSYVSGLNATIIVQYESECAGAVMGSGTFTGQILLANKASRFLNSGDSGSLLVEDVAVNPRAVGLLFAGSTSVAVANPIQEVLGTFGVSMVGVNSAVTAAATTAFEGDLQKAKVVQERHGRSLQQAPKVVGHALAVEASARGPKAVILVLLEEDDLAVRQAIPRELDGVAVRVQVVGRIVAF